MLTLFDSHAHLQFAQYDEDRQAVIARSRDWGVIGILNVGADLESSRAAVALAARYEFMFASVGVHPHDADKLSSDVLAELRALAADSGVVAIGEIGLDYYRDLAPRDAQRRAFERQLALAVDLGLPAIVHSRDAHRDALTILDEWPGTGVLHSYSAGPDALTEVLDMGFSIGISGPVTYPRADELRRVVECAPIDRLLVETDCPYLAPVPYRGRRNEPAYVRYVVEMIADVRGIPAEEVAEATAANARRLFGIR
ncbi:MAG: TatD family hydrolase [Chloroflexi bacterium]|nr:TatD family hydrolase [Chloroflexota bacterium]